MAGLIRAGLLCSAIALAQLPPIPGAGSQRVMPAAPFVASEARVFASPAASKVEYRLLRLADADRQARAMGARLSDLHDLLPADVAGLLEAEQARVDDRGRVQVYVSVRDFSVLPALSSVLSVERIDAGSGTIQGMLTIPLVEGIAGWPEIAGIRLPPYGVPQAGSVTSEGDAILRAAELRGALGVDGSGVRVGVIANGVEGLAASQASGDLPAVNTTTCNVTGGDPAALGAGAEGTAMLEIVHDLAPGAELWFGYFGMGTDLDFMAAVDCLAAHTDVVVDDILWFNAGPYDGTSAVSQNASVELNSAANRIRGYYNAAGNEAVQHYHETYVASGYVLGGAKEWRMHRFQETAATTDGGEGWPCLTGPVYCGDPVRVLPGGVFTVYLQWDDPWGNSANDYDLLVWEESNPTVASVGSANPQTGLGSNPVEAFSRKNTHASTTDFDIIIGTGFGRAAPRTFDMFIRCTACVPIAGNTHNFNTQAGSIPNNADAGGGVLAVGAIDAADPGNDTVEPYSSRGPTGDGRTKPDLAAVDGVRVTGNGGVSTDFHGTSAAASHAGAIAALLLSCNPSLLSGEPGDDPAADRGILRQALTASAVDLGVAGADNAYGFGRVDAVAAAAAAGCLAASPTPTSTPAPPATTTPTPTRSATPMPTVTPTRSATPTPSVTPTPSATVGPQPGDADGDGVIDALDNCVLVYNPDQANTDGEDIANGRAPADDITNPAGDNLGDACDDDDDNDGLLDAAEVAWPVPGCPAATSPTNPLAADSDGDGVIDGAECGLGSNPADAASKPAPDTTCADPDGDGVRSTLETRGWGTNSGATDSDGDARADGVEIVDVDGNAVANFLDALVVAKASAGAAPFEPPPLTPEEVRALDLDRNGAVNFLDALFAAKRASSLPAC